MSLSPPQIRLLIYLSNLPHRPKSIIFPTASKCIFHVLHKDFLPYASLDDTHSYNQTNIIANSDMHLLLLLLSPF